MAISFPVSGISEIVVFEGAVFLHSETDTLADGVVLRKGDLELPFAPADAPRVDALLGGRSIAMNLATVTTDMISDPVQETPGDRFACWVNHLVDWSLTGSQTIQLMVARRDKPLHLTLPETLTVRQRNRPREFRTHLAAHRARATLHVTFRDTATGSEKVHDIEFDPACRGGQLENLYQDVRIPLPDDIKSLTISVAISYNGYEDDGSDHDPFLFITQPQVVPPRQSAAITVPARLGQAGAGEGHWFSAPVPQPLAGEDVIETLFGDDNRAAVFSATAADITLDQDHGHTLIFRTPEARTAVLAIDGQFVERLELSAGNTVYRMPVTYLTGISRRISLYDGTGTHELWSTEVLLPNVLTPADIIQRETNPPYPVAMFPQTARRYDSLKRQMANATPDTDFAQLTRALAVLEGGYERVHLAPLAFPRVDDPEGSVVIPAHNKVEATYHTLCSLLLAHNRASFEVILVDDASTDETATIENLVKGISVIHTDEPQRFIRACNAGAERARGKFVVLLNNDVEVTSGWLDELVDAFGRFDNVGIAGARLIYPNGLLQDAGGIVWGNGNPWNYGNSSNPDEPRFSYARQTDYLSGAALMIPTALWRELRGLSSYLEPMYFEDTDLAFKVRDRGYTTWYVPSSVVYHHEGTTSGTDVTTGFKKYQEVNRPKFKRHWARAFSDNGQEGIATDLEKDRGIVGRVLFIDYSVIRPDQDAGSYAALQEMKLVQSLGYKVTFLPANLAHLGSYTEDLQKQGIEVIYAPFYLSTGEYLERHARDFDAFYITRFYVAQETLPTIRRHAPKAKVLFNNADLHFLREIRSARAQNKPELLEKAKETRARELAIIEKVDVVLSYNEVEHSVIQAYTDGAATVVKCPWVVDIPETVAPLKGRAGISFLGGFRHHPNVEGIAWFVHDVMPMVNAAVPGLQLSVYGSGMSDEVRALAGDTVRIPGFVADIADAFDPHRLFIAPLLSGAGIKGKVLSALAYGIPCVLSPTAAEGIGLRDGLDCLIAETSNDWADAISRLQTDDALWQKLSDNAREYMQTAFSFDKGRARMRAAFEAADMYQSFE